MGRLCEWLVMGEIVKAQGIRGEVKIALATDDAQRLCGIKRLKVRHGGVEKDYAVLAMRADGRMAYAALEGVASRDGAEALRGGAVLMARDDLPPLQEGRYYLCDLVGCAVVDETGESVGTVREVLQNGGADVYVISAGALEAWMPALRENLLDVDVASGRIVIRRAGLLEVDGDAY